MVISLSYSFGQNKPNQVVAGIPVNHDEVKAGSYILPDPLEFNVGKPVRDVKSRTDKLSAELVKLLEDYLFVRMPGTPGDMSFYVFDRGTLVFNGTAIRKQVTDMMPKAGQPILHDPGY